MIALGRPCMASPLAILEFQPSKHLSHQLLSAGRAVWPSAGKHMMFPGIRLVSVLPLAIGPCQQAFSHLEQEVGQVKGFGSR